MNIACVNAMMVPEVQAVVQKYTTAPVRQQGPNFGSPMIWLMVDTGLGNDQESALRRQIAQIPGTTIWT